ncbi:MAG: CPBP family intramembrane metalloprotease [Deltaproteobacteria bacterium]|nr:CPBP family intramembrane metalloprotease [Deltaproteobacteria bacterium]
MPEGQDALAAPVARAPTLGERLAALFPGLDRTSLIVIVVAALDLLVSSYEGSTGFFDAKLRPHLHLASHADSVISHVWWFGTAFVLLLLIPLLVSKLAGGPSARELGLGVGDWRLGLKVSLGLLALMVPIVAIAARSPAFNQQYPFCADALSSWRLLIVYELGYLAYFIAWEFIFRGWMLFGLAPRLGPGLAIVLQALPFSLMHTGKPELEAYGSILAGLALGALAWRTRSMWYGAALHGLVALAMDLFAGAHRAGVLHHG